MPFACIPLEVHGHVLQGLSPQDQARVRGCSPDTVYGYTIAVVNEQFIMAAGSLEVVDSLSSFDVRWFPLNTRFPRRVRLESAVLNRWQPTSAMQRISCRRLVFLLPKSTTPLGHITIDSMRNADAERVAFVGFDDAASVAFPHSCLRGCGALTTLLHQ